MDLQYSVLLYKTLLILIYQQTQEIPKTMADNFQNYQDQQIEINSDRRMASISNRIQTSQQLSVSPKSQTPSTVSNHNHIPATTNSYDLSNAAHPVACIATIFFKAASLFIYLFLSALIPNVLTFISVMVSSALDFWTVKNVTGRLLVGLRWWSQYNEKGQQIWRFQSFDKQFVSNAVDSAFFWSAQIIATVVWGFFLLIKLLSLNLFWGILTAINFAFCVLNLYGYYKCRGDYMKKFQGLKSSGLRTLAGRLFL